MHEPDVGDGKGKTIPDTNGRHDLCHGQEKEDLISQLSCVINTLRKGDQQKSFDKVKILSKSTCSSAWL